MISLQTEAFIESDIAKQARFESFHPFSQLISSHITDVLSEWDARYSNGFLNLQGWSEGARAAITSALNQEDFRDWVNLEEVTYIYARELRESSPAIQGHDFTKGNHPVVDAIAAFNSGIRTSFDIREKVGTYLVEKTEAVPECIQGQTRAIANRISLGHPTLPLTVINFLFDQRSQDTGMRFMDYFIFYGHSIHHTIDRCLYEITPPPYSNTSVFESLMYLIEEYNAVAQKAYENGAITKPMGCPQRDVRVPLEGVSTKGRQIERSAFNLILNATNNSELATIRNMRRL